MEEKKLTDDTEIDVGMIVKALEKNCICVVYGGSCETCPLFDEPCSEILPKAIKDLIHRLQDENERLTREVDKQKNFVTAWEESWKIANEQNTKTRVKLKKENAERKKQVEAWKARAKELEESWEISSSNEEKLQKQVDELTEERANLKAEIATQTLKYEALKTGKIIASGIFEVLNKAKKTEIREQAVKDTAKEILQELWDETEPLNESHKWVRLRIKNIASRKGVEVE